MPYINELLIAVSMILMLLAVIGCFLPVIPGPPIALIGLFLAHASGYAVFQVHVLIIYSVLIAVITLLDYALPVWGTQKFGGSKMGMWGSMAGLVAGLIFFPPFGFLIGAFAGAWIAELIAGKSLSLALRAAFGSFLGILTGIIFKLTICVVVTVHIILKMVF